jgi:hypothetical protein
MKRQQWGLYAVALAVLLVGSSGPVSQRPRCSSACLSWHAR